MVKQNLENKLCDVEIKKGVCGKYECPGQRVFEKYNKERNCNDIKTCYWYLISNNLPLPKKKIM